MNSETIILSDLAATARLAHLLAGVVKGGDILALSGDVGAGKTSLARLLIQALTGPDTLVPSPTFTMVQEYNVVHPTLNMIRHYDLYRLGDESELLELGWDDVGAADILTLVEWPENAGTWLDSKALWLFLHQDDTQNNDRRWLRLRGDKNWANHLAILRENHDA